jgi:periplasmic protein TonB
MLSQAPGDVYSAEEIARAAGVPAGPVVAALGGGSGLVSFADAVRVGRALAHGRRPPRTTAPRQLFSSLTPDDRPSRSKGVPLVVSSTLHVTVLAVAVFIATLGLAPKAATLRSDDHPEPMRLVFLVTPGPGGGGGGGGLLQPAPPPKAMREGHQKMSSPIPVRQPPRRIAPIAAPPEPKSAAKTEVALAVVAPIVAAPADPRTRIGLVAQAAAQAESHGSGRGGGVGSGTGPGLGEGDGAGIGPGSGGGIGGGPYRPGSGIEAPRLLREVKADYTEEARQRGIEGDVVLEIIVRRDGTVGNVKVLQGLGSGLNDRAAQAVRQWRFAPAQHLGTPVDVIVEVAVEFKLR